MFSQISSSTYLYYLSFKFSSHLLKSQNHFALHIGTLINLDQLSLYEQVIAGYDPIYLNTQEQMPWMYMENAL